MDLSRILQMTQVREAENIRIIQRMNQVGWFVGCLRTYVASAVFQPYRDLEAGDNQSLKIQVARPGIVPRSSCSTSQELNHSATAAPKNESKIFSKYIYAIYKYLFSFHFKIKQNILSFIIHIYTAYLDSLLHL